MKVVYEGNEVILCSEECEKSARLHGCAEILKAPEPDGSCWKCGGVGFVTKEER